MRLSGRLALVTGASWGIGEATAKLLAREGASVVLVARTQARLEQVAADIRRAGGQAHAVPTDVGDAAAVSRAARHVTAEIGDPQIVVNSAGAGRFLFIDETSPEELVQMTALPYFAAFYVTKAFLPGMLGGEEGAIVNIDSPASLFVWPGAIGYIAARWALRGFSEALRADLRGTGIRVVSVFPGKVLSHYDDVNIGADKRVPRVARVSRTLTSEEMAGAIVRGLKRNRRAIYAPLGVRLTAAQARLFPRLTNWVMARTGASRADIDRAEVERSALGGADRRPSGSRPRGAR